MANPHTARPIDEIDRPGPPPDPAGGRQAPIGTLSDAAAVSRATTYARLARRAGRPQGRPHLAIGSVRTLDELGPDRLRADEPLAGRGSKTSLASDPEKFTAALEEVRLRAAGGP